MDSLVKSQFLSLYCMVLADGVIDARELSALYRIGVEQYGLSQEAINSVIRDSGTSFVVPDSLEDKVKFLYNMAQIAYADGMIDPAEKSLLAKYIIKMGFAKENVEGISNFLFKAVSDEVSIEDVLKQII